MAVELKAMLRDSKKSINKQLRKEGKIPAIIYGKTIGNQNVAVEEGELIKVFNHAGRNEVIQLEVEGQSKTSVMTQDLQRDPIKNQLIHVDFKEVNMNEAVEVAVPLHIVGEDAIEKKDGVVNHNVNEIRVRALPGHIPAHIDIDVSELEVGDTLKVSKLIHGLQTEYEILDDEEEVLITINRPQLAPEAEPVEDEAANEEPGNEETGQAGEE